MVEQVSFSPSVAVSAPSTPSSTEARAEAIQEEASFEEGVQSPAVSSQPGPSEDGVRGAVVSVLT